MEQSIVDYVLFLEDRVKELEAEIKAYQGSISDMEKYVGLTE